MPRVQGDLGHLLRVLHLGQPAFHSWLRPGCAAAGLGPAMSKAGCELCCGGWEKLHLMQAGQSQKD